MKGRVTLRWARSSRIGCGKVVVRFWRSTKRNTTNSVTSCMWIYRKGNRPYQLRVPVRMHFPGDRTENVTVMLTNPTQRVAIATTDMPVSVEVDPDYHVFRKLPAEWLVPNLARTQAGASRAVVTPPGTMPAPLQAVQRGFEAGVTSQDRTVLVAGRIGEGALAERALLILGDAVRDPYVAGFLSAVEFPVRFMGSGFVLQGVTYDDPGCAVLCTIEHPGVTGGGITVLAANSQDALPDPERVLRSDHSVVIYEHGRPILQQDFEPVSRVPVVAAPH